jgi:hypothetical protein
MECAILAVHEDKTVDLIDIKGQLVTEDLASIGKFSIYDYLKSAVDKHDLLSWPSFEGIYKLNFNIDNFVEDNEQSVFILDLCKIDNIDNLMEHYFI